MNSSYISGFNWVYNRQMISEKMHATIRKYVLWLEQFADRVWYPPLIAFLSALDNLIIIIPNDGILIGSSMLVPRRWAIFAISVAIGSTIGALTLGYLVEQNGLPWIMEFYPEIDQSRVWIWSDKFFGDYGLLLVFAVSLSPLLQQPVVILAALANTPLWQMAMAVFIGRFIKFMIMAFLGSHSPRLLKKMWGLKDELKDAGVKID